MAKGGISSAVMYSKVVEPSSRVSRSLLHVATIEPLVSRVQSVLCPVPGPRFQPGIGWDIEFGRGCPDRGEMAHHPNERRRKAPRRLEAIQARVEKVVKKCTPETVAILIGFGAGSGVIVSEDGLVLTAAHVITGEDLMGKGGPYESGKPCTIVLADGKHVKGKTLGVNSDNDVGMVQITDKGPNNGKWPFLPVAKSATLKKGEWVVSLGHPGGPKIGRPPVARLGRIEARTSDIVRSNCTLVGGDSGGPLFDLDGNVVGIHSRIGLTLAQNIHVPIELFQAQWERAREWGNIWASREAAGGQALAGSGLPRGR